MEVFTKIQAAAERLFNRFGIRSVTMDDVAKELSISKKTLYKHYPDKNELVRTTVQKMLDRISNQFERILAQEANPILQLFAISRFMIDMLEHMNPSMLYDLEKYHKDCFDLFVEHREMHALRNAKTNLEAGQAQGLYRSDLDTEIVARAFYSMMFHLLGPHETAFHQQFENKRSLVNELIQYHLHGICSEKGLVLVQSINWNQPITHEKNNP
ncbi:MAG: TetR/AcrR family transcriptional regulator [Bacteroidia bacterium]